MTNQDLVEKTRDLYSEFCKGSINRTHSEWTMVRDSMDALIPMLSDALESAEKSREALSHRLSWTVSDFMKRTEGYESELQKLREENEFLTARRKQLLLESKDLLGKTTILKQALEKAIDDEPELPGQMPDHIFQAVKNDKDAIAEMNRITVRLTKKGIKERFQQTLSQLNEQEKK